ncbi:MLP-like protein 34 [Pistacia vera]|uniref:MLP-like protein 34 n=1 Tax=Pistacia vera TaxID=55513 RepID=UPI0012631ACD|nr:MLP-like protein 34 [Pistacia vera]
MSPDKVQSVHIQKEDGKSKGSVKKWDYTLDGEEISATETIEAADDSKKMITFKIMDGEIMKAFKNFKATAQAIPKEESCLVKWIVEYEKRSQNIPDPVDYRELATKKCRDMDGHLAANFN